MCPNGISLIQLTQSGISMIWFIRCHNVSCCLREQWPYLEMTGKMCETWKGSVLAEEMVIWSCSYTCTFSWSQMYLKKWKFDSSTHRIYRLKSLHRVQTNTYPKLLGEIFAKSLVSMTLALDNKTGKTNGNWNSSSSRIESDTKASSSSNVFHGYCSCGKSFSAVAAIALFLMISLLVFSYFPEVGFIGPIPAQNNSPAKLWEGSYKVSCTFILMSRHARWGSAIRLKRQTRRERERYVTLELFSLIVLI